MSVPMKNILKTNISNNFLPERFLDSRRALWLLLFYALILIFNDLSTPGLVSFDDCYYAQKGWEMLKGDDLITPHYGGREDFINPPLFFWMMAFSFAIFGKTAFAVKFFTALCGLLTVFVVYETGKVIRDRETGWWGGFFLATSYIFLKSSRRAMMDVPFAFFAAVSLLFFIKASRVILNKNYLSSAKSKSAKPAGSERKKITEVRMIWLNLMLSGFFAGLAGLIKTVLIVFVLGIPILFAVIHWKQFKRFFLPLVLFIIIAVMVCSWWFVYEYLTYGKVFIDGFYNKMLSGQIHGVQRMESGPLGYLYEFGRHFWLWLPLTLWAVWMIIKEKKWKSDLWLQFLLLSAFLPVFLLSFAGNKTIRYVLFTFPPIVLLTALVFTSSLKKVLIRRLTAAAIAFLTLLSAYLIVRPVDLGQINNADYIQLGRLIESGKLVLHGEKFYHYKGEFWINHNPLFYYAGVRLAGIVENTKSLETLSSSSESYYILLRITDFAEIPISRFTIIDQFRDRILLRYK